MNERPTPSYPLAARELLRNSLLDAATELMRDYSWSDLSMAAIATRAGVSRQTLYNEFGSREEFSQAFALREAYAFLRSVELAIAAHPHDPGEAIQAAFAGFLHEAGESPMVRAIVARDPGVDELFALFTTRGGPVIALATEHITRAVLKNWPIDAATVRIAAEALVRLAISHASLPTAPITDAARAIGALLGPFVRKAIESSATLPAAPGKAQKRKHA